MSQTDLACMSRRICRCLLGTVGVLLVSCAGPQMADYPYGQVRDAALPWENDLLSFRYPEGWRPLFDIGHDYGTILLRPEEPSELEANPFIRVEYYRSEDSPTRAANDHARLVIGGATGPVDVHHWKTSIAAAPARVLTYSWVPHDDVLRSGATEMHERKAFIQHGDYLVTVTYAVDAEGELDYKPDFDTVLSTLSFKSAESP